MKSLYFHKQITADCASRICCALSDKLGNCESSTASDRGAWISEATWRYRVKDGSSWAKLGFGPTRKMVTVQLNDQKPGRAMLFVSVPENPS